MRIAFITAGAAGMYCGSCLRDNSLARAMMARGHDVLLLPTYTPTRTDEPNVSQPRVFLGGINIYLQHKSAIFRHTPWFADQWLDSPKLLNWAAGLGMKTDAKNLGPLTVAILRGENGPSHKEFVKLATWLAGEVKPDVVDISNGLLLGIATSIRRRLGAPIFCTFSGEDIFLESLEAPWRTAAVELLREQCEQVDGFITFSRYYADAMRALLGIPETKIYIVPLGINLDGHGRLTRPTAGTLNSTANVGYLARICPEKGLHLLCEAFRMLHEQDRFRHCRLRVAGYLGSRDRPYWQALERSLAEWGLRDLVEYVGEPDRAGKIQFLQSLDVFSVPTVYRESKGLPVLEAWANGIPVVQPWHGVFPEFMNNSQAGVLVPPNNPRALADALAQLLENESLRVELGTRGRTAVERTYNVDRMAEATLAVYQSVAPKP